MWRTPSEALRGRRCGRRAARRGATTAPPCLLLFALCNGGEQCALGAPASDAQGSASLIPLLFPPRAAITRDSRHKRRLTGGRKHPHQKKRKFEVGKPPSMTKMGSKRIHLVRGRGGNLKYRALRLESGNFSWGGENVTKKTRILDVVYNASNNELVRTKTLVKSAVVMIDATPFRQWFETQFRLKVAKKTGEEGTGVKLEAINREAIRPETQKKIDGRIKDKAVDPKIEEQFATGRLLAVISSRPGQSGRCDGYVLEGPELEFYQKKLALKKTSKGK